MEVFAYALKITELSVYAVTSGAFIFYSVSMFKKMQADITNKEIVNTLENKFDELLSVFKKLEQGHLNKEGLKDLMPFFVQSVRWKLQKSVIDIININNINKNFDIVMKKIDLYYQKERNEINNILNIMASENNKCIVLHTVITELQANERVIKSIIEEIKELNEIKYDKNKYKADVNAEMAQFEENTISAANNVLGG